MKTPAQKLEEMLKQIEAMPPVDLSAITLQENNKTETENIDDIRNILIEEKEVKKKKKSKEREEEEASETPIEIEQPQLQNPLTVDPKSLKTGFMRRKTDIKVPEGVKSVSGPNRMPMASSQMDQILSGMMLQPSIISRQRANLTNSYTPFDNSEKTVLSENIKAKVTKILNNPKYQKEINRMKKEISGNNDNSR